MKPSPQENDFLGVLGVVLMGGEDELVVMVDFVDDWAFMDAIDFEEADD